MPGREDNDEPTAGTPADGVPAEGGDPEKIGPYRVKRLLGAGGMGVVYEGFHERLRRPVAIKVIGESWRSEEARRRFESEASIVASLNHPAIAHIYDYGEFEHAGETLPFIAMEYVVGARPVTDYCREASPGLTTTLEMFELLFDALAHVGERGIVHRDIKPANVLVDPDGRPRIIDFGLSLAWAGGGAFDSLHAEGGRPAGTLSYMSPEQRAGDPLALDRRTDIYSMALVMYEALTGARPQRSTEGGFPPPSRRVRGIGPDLDALLADALREDPRERTQTAGEVRDRIRWSRERMLRSRAGPERRARTRQNIARWAVAGLSAAVGAWVIFPLFCIVLPVCGGYATWAMGVITDDEAGYENVRVVTITERTLEAPGVAGDDGSPLSIFELRSRHADLMDRLVSGAPRAVAWDVFFMGPTPHDSAFAESISRAIDRGVPVVLMTGTWTGGGLGPAVSKELASAASAVAPGTGIVTAERPWSVDLASQRADGFVTPGFALAVVSLIDRPRTFLDVELQKETKAIRVRRWSPGGLSGRRQVGATLSFPVSGMRPIPDRQRVVDLAPGDIVAEILVSIPGDDALDRASVRYEDVLRMDQNELVSTFSGRVVVIGRADEEGRDLRNYPDGRRIAGVWAHADAIERLLMARRVFVPGDPTMRGLAGAAAALGAIALFRGGRGAKSGLIALSIGLLLAIGACLAALAAPAIVYPGPVVGSAVCGGLIGAGAWRLIRLPEHF